MLAARRTMAPAALGALVAVVAASLPALLLAEDLSKLIVTKNGATASIGSVLELDPDNFATHVAGDVNIFVKFYAPWCGHCKRIAPVWQDLAVHLLTVPALKHKTIIADVNADEHEDLAREYDVSGFPTFIHFPAFNTSQRPMVYTAEQDVASFTKFLMARHMGQLSTKRRVSKVFALDVLAWRFRQGDAETQEDMMSRVRAVMEKETTPELMKQAAEIYLKLMEKSLKAEDFGSFFEKERERLDRLMKSGQLSEDQMRDVTSRHSIVEAFIVETKLPGGVSL